jgi:hypothetical protein
MNDEQQGQQTGGNVSTDASHSSACMCVHHFCKAKFRPIPTV